MTDVHLHYKMKILKVFWKEETVMTEEEWNCETCQYQTVQYYYSLHTDATVQRKLHNKSRLN